MKKKQLAWVLTMAMTAGMRHQALVAAFGAAGPHLRAGLGAAMLDRRQGPIVLGPKLAPVLRQESRFEGFDHRGEPDHLTLPQSMQELSIRPVIRSMA